MAAYGSDHSTKQESVSGPTGRIQRRIVSTIFQLFSNSKSFKNIIHFKVKTRSKSKIVHQDSKI